MKFWRNENRLNFWPAYVDLMIVFAVVGIISAATYKSSLEGEVGKIRKLEGEVVKIKKFIEIRVKIDSVVDNLHQELARSKINVIEKADGIRLTEGILKFDSGKVEPMMNENVENIFQRICEAIKKSIDKIPDGNQILCIVIEGHTDSQEIGSELAKYYPTNWELSAARATSILRMMCSPPYGLHSDRYKMNAVGFGDKKPIEEGKIISQANRRIEISILPNYEKIEEIVMKHPVTKP
jgi:chemotaxis protein MotB